MKAPAFWWCARKSQGARALAPLGSLYGAAVALRRFLARPYQARVPLICVGNIVVGGAGKTPTCLALAKLLALRGHKTAFVSRGYGGRERGPLRVDPQRHRADAVGDEALLFARMAPCWIARVRADAVREAEKEAEVIVLDDGLQNPTIAPDLRLLVVDGEVGFGNGLLIPAGPLRETIAGSGKRIDALVLIGKDQRECASFFEGKPIFTASLKPSLGADFLARPDVLAFAGIGRPGKFYTSCHEAGLRVVETQDFPDHHPFREDELALLKKRAESRGLRLITTAKDFERLSPAWRAEVAVLSIELVFDDPEKVAAFVLENLKNAKKDERETP